MTDAELIARMRGYAGDLPQRIHDDLRSAADRIEALSADVAALKHDIARHIQIAADLAQENEELRESLREVLELCKVAYGASHEDVADFLAFTGRAHAALGDLK